MIRTSQKSFFHSGTVVVPAGATVEYYCTGQLFICKEASDVFYVSFNDGAFFKMEVGLGFRLVDPDEFTKLSFRNDTASAVTIEFYAGVGEIRDARLNTVIDRLVIVGLKDVADYSKGLGVVGAYRVAGAGGTTYAGTDPATGRQRKQIVLTNCDAGNIWITDANDLVVGIVGAGQIWTLQSAATFKVYRDPNGGNLNYLVGQTFWNA